MPNVDVHIAWRNGQQETISVFDPKLRSEGSVVYVLEQRESEAVIAVIPHDAVLAVRIDVAPEEEEFQPKPLHGT